MNRKAADLTAHERAAIITRDLMEGERLETYDSERRIMENGRMLDVDIKAALSLVGRKQYENKEKGMSNSDARNQAAAEVAASLVPPMTGGELLSLFGKYGAEINNEKHNRGNGNGKEQPAKKPLPPPPPPPVSSAPASLTQYRLMALEQDFIPDDKILAHFSGKTPQSYGSASYILKQEGFVFEKVEGGWKVTARPIYPPAPIPDPIFDAILKILMGMPQASLQKFARILGLFSELTPEELEQLRRIVGWQLH